MDPQNRTLLKVTIDDARAADMLFDKLMGDKVDKSCRVDIRNEGKSCSYRNRKIWTYW